MHTRRPIYRGRVIDLGIESVTQPDGRVLEIEIARHPGGAVALPWDPARGVCLLRQYRATLDTWLWEAPAGKIDPGEAPLSTAQRELAEEAGLRARDWTGLGRLVTCPGFSDEVLHLYLARRLEEVPSGVETGEYLEVHWLPLDEALERTHDDTIRDAKTVAALCRAATLLAGKAPQD